MQVTSFHPLNLTSEAKEAIEPSMSCGFRRARVFENGVETPSSIFAIIVLPSGTIYDLCQRVKK